MGPFERFKKKTHFNSLKRLVGITALAALAVKLLVVALATAAGGGTPLDLLARVPASLADLGAALIDWTPSACPPGSPPPADAPAPSPGPARMPPDAGSER